MMILYARKNDGALSGARKPCQTTRWQAWNKRYTFLIRQAKRGISSSTQAFVPLTRFIRRKNH